MHRTMIAAAAALLLTTALTPAKATPSSDCVSRTLTDNGFTVAQARQLKIGELVRISYAPDAYALVLLQKGETIKSLCKVLTHDAVFNIVDEARWMTEHAEDEAAVALRKVALLTHVLQTSVWFGDLWYALQHAALATNAQSSTRAVLLSGIAADFDIPLEVLWGTLGAFGFAFLTILFNFIARAAPTQMETDPSPETEQPWYARKQLQVIQGDKAN